MTKPKQSGRAAAPVRPAVGKSLTEFRSVHDKSFWVPQRIRDAIKKLGPDGWEYEVAFLKLAALSTTDLAAYRGEFEEFIVTTTGRNPKRAWCGSAAFAKRLREMV